MSTGTALDVTILKNNNKLTQFYTGLPSYDSFLATVDYLEPKAKEMIGWNSSKTKELNISGKQCVPRCFSSMSMANQLFSVLIRLRLGLLAADVSMRFKISEKHVLPALYNLDLFFVKGIATAISFSNTSSK